LKNKDSILPLDKNAYKTIAVIGPNANSRDALLGNYIGTSSEYITPLEGIQQAVATGTRVLYAEGCHLYKNKSENLAEDKDRFVEAMIAAEQADLVIMCLGLDATLEGEEGDAGNEYASGDKLGLRLPGFQQELLEEVASTGKKIVLLLSAGSAIDLSWAQEHVDAIVDTWYPGARGGKAITDVLFGEYSPSGKLPVTFYSSTDALPDFEDYSMQNRTYRYAKNNILYPFGYGLKYSELEYSKECVSKETSEVLEDITLSATVTNKGSYTVDESVQVYVKYEDADELAPGFQLKGIQCIKLEPGQSKDVSVTLNPRAFATITDEGKCVVKPGTYTVTIGGQQPDERSKELTQVEVASFTVSKMGNETEVEY